MARLRAAGPRILLPALLILLGAAPSASAYATFTHEELIELAWNPSIRPLLLKRYPNTTEEGLRVAHAFALGGCLIQDLGYYPLGKGIFSDLAHYVRSGDFVASLLRNAHDVNELAFAIGALSHYVGDSIGHSEAVNPSTGITFPKLAKKYGSVVTYEDEPTAHVRTEFGFDVAQVAFWRYPPHQYREWIGFHVARPLLEHAYYETYGLRVRSILGPPRSALDSYRFAVRKIIPLFAKATIVNVHHHLPPDPPDPPLQQFMVAVSQSDYDKYWSGYHHGPTLEDHVLGIVIRLIPKIGVLKILAIKAPSVQTEDLFLESFNNALRRFEERLAEVASGKLALPNRDLDTGARVKPGAYKLTDQTYATLLDRLTRQPGPPIPAGLREDILAYYADSSAPIATKQNPKAWNRVVAELKVLEQMPTRPEPEERLRDADEDPANDSK
ncbi:MAG: zinc dependent phospholipase C family protein [Acidobacteriia bacterium]|nr:zinc dependent phospholipase C family protein [Terriglobia bacterium]